MGPLELIEKIQNDIIDLSEDLEELKKMILPSPVKQVSIEEDMNIEDKLKNLFGSN